MHKKEMAAMKADMEKMKASLAEMKANTFTIRDPNDLARWRKINSETLPALNQFLKQNKMVPLPLVAVDKDPKCPN